MDAHRFRSLIAEWQAVLYPHCAAAEFAARADEVKQFCAGMRALTGCRSLPDRAVLAALRVR
jgi:hypothetical protein